MGNKFHYFASHALGYAMAESREEAIDKLIEGFHHDLKPWLLNCHKAGDPGVYMWSCKVKAPMEAAYKIEWYAPKGVETEDGREHYLTYLTKKKHAVYNKPKHESLAKPAKEAA